MLVHSQYPHYSQPHEVLELLAQRQAKRSLVEEWMQEHWQAGFPTVLANSDKPKAVFARHLHSFRMEDAVFTQYASQLGLVPTFLSYIEDKFTTTSSYKLTLLKMQFLERFGRKGGPVLQTLRFQNPTQWDGKSLKDIKCAQKGYLVDFHRAILKNRLSSLEYLSQDGSGFLKGSASDYYGAYLAMFVAHGVLFEDYHGGESGNQLDGFTSTIFEPAFRWVEETFGVKPLIVPMPTWHEHQSYFPKEGVDWQNLLIGCVHDHDQSLLGLKKPQKVFV